MQPTNLQALHFLTLALSRLIYYPICPTQIHGQRLAFSWKVQWVPIREYPPKRLTRFHSPAKLCKVHDELTVPECNLDLVWGTV